MSFGFLPLTGYLGLCIIISIILIYYSVTRWNKDRKGLIVLYMTGAVGAILWAVIRLLKETGIYYKYYNAMGFIVWGYLGVVGIEFLYLSLTHKGDEKSKRTILIGWGLIVAALLLGALAFVILD